jgi:hypothetical protein
LRSGSAVIHRLTISGWGERDENTSSPSASDHRREPRRLH